VCERGKSDKVPRPRKESEYVTHRQSRDTRARESHLRHHNHITKRRKKTKQNKQEEQLRNQTSTSKPVVKNQNRRVFE
jgi:hypothetical protein